VAPEECLGRFSEQDQLRNARSSRSTLKRLDEGVPDPRPPKCGRDDE
jgi:hypothetical protein